MENGELSPLKRFAECKGEIRRTFKSLQGVINETEDFLQTIEGFSRDESERMLLSIGDPDYDTIHQQKDINQFREVVGAISSLLERDNMKVVFVGHTSNGKSTVINSMLGDIVLPMGIGHTTHCFCSVEGTSGETYMTIGQSPEKLNITTVKQVANALSPEATDDRHQIVRVFWDKDKCTLLSEGVNLMDTPGLDIDENYDMWIDKFCMDADVFVLVANGESTLKQTEMTFLKRVSEKLSRPNVFVLFNRWDGSDMEEDAEGVKAQHREKATKFLANDLHLDMQGGERVFFVSAKEMLLTRTKGKVFAEPEPRQRLDNFISFEHNFAECISLSAIRTKFESHVVRGQDIAGRLHEWLSRITWTAKLQQTECRGRLDDRGHQLEELSQKRNGVIAQCESVVEDLGDTVACEFERGYEELVEARLPSLVNRFDYAIFTPDNTAKYKERILEYLGKEMCTELQEICGADLQEAYARAQQTMASQVRSVVPGHLDFRVQTLGKSPIVPSLFTMGVLDDFHEDVQFRFSLGWSALGPRLLGYSSFSAVDSLLYGRPPAPTAKHQQQQQYQPTAQDVAALAIIPAASAYVPLVTVAATLAARPAFWKAILTVAGVYTALYAWEYLTFTNASRERRFKAQLVDHVRTHYRHIMMQVSLNVKSHYSAGIQAQLEHLSLQINERTSMLWKEKGMLERAIERLVRLINSGESASQHAQDVSSDLAAFSKTYLSDSL